MSVLASALASALLPIVVCIAAGSAVGRGRSRWPGADMLVGFGLLGGVLTILAVTTRIPLSWLMISLAGVSMIALIAQRQLPGGRSTWIALVLTSPILVMAADHKPAMWDDFWNWLPNAAYSYSHDSLVRPDLPPSFSIFPGYPQSMPLMIAAASFVAGRFVETTGPVINVALLAGSSALLADAMAATLVRQGRLQATGTPPVLVALAVAITTIFNPGLNGAVMLSSYADCGTMVAVGALGLLGVEMLARSAVRDDAGVEGFAWRFGFVAVVLINLKQANAVLLALVVTGLALVALRDPAIRKWQALLQLPRMLAPAIVVWMAWRWYVVQNVPAGEQSFRSFDLWNFDALSRTFAAIGATIAAAPLFHAMMWLVTAAGVIFLLLPDRASEARRLAVICATVWLGYNAFLLLVYLGALSVYDARIAADYWRFTPHVALLALYVPVLALANRLRAEWMSPWGAIPTLAAVLLALGALWIRTDLNNPPGRAWQRFLRDAVGDMRQIIPPGSKLLVVPVWNSSPFGVAVRYNLWQLGVPEKQIFATILWDSDEFPKVASWATQGQADYLLVQDAEGVMDEVTDTLGLPRINRELVLFGWRNGAWKKVKSWPVPPEVQRDT